MKNLNKIVNIALIFMLIISVASSQLTYAGEGLCLRVPITRDVKREKGALLEIQRKEIKERLAKLSVIKNKKPEEITEEDRKYLAEAAHYFNLWEEYWSEQYDKKRISQYTIALFILTSAELESLDIVTTDSLFALLAADEIGRAFSPDNLEDIFRGINNLIDNSSRIPKDSTAGKQVDKFLTMAKTDIQELQAWKLILKDWKEFDSLDSKVMIALLDRFIKYVEKNRNLQSHITKYVTEHKSEIGDDIVRAYSEKAEYAKFGTRFIRKTLIDLSAQAKVNRLINIGEKLKEISQPYRLAYDISFQINPQLPYFYGNLLRLSYIFKNLFSNTRDVILEAERTKKLMERTGNVSIKIRGNEDIIEIKFSYNGVGILEKKYGTGLRLDIIDRIVGEYNGSIEQRNKPEGVAEFTITLPVVKPDQVNNNDFASLSNDQLIREAENSMPFCEDTNPDWTRFNEIVKQLKTRKDVQVFVLAGPMFNDNEAININRLTQPETVISSDDAEFDFLWCTLQNISQHVKQGIALVVKQEITNEKGSKYTEISVIDNGTGPIDKNSKRVSVKEVLKYGVTMGVNDSAGRGLTLAARHNADLSTIHAPGISVIVNGKEEPERYRVSPPEIIWEQDKTKKPYGMTVIGYFLGKGADKEDVKEDIIKRAEQHVNSFQLNQMYGIRETSTSL